MGAKKFGMSLETREIKLFGGISRDFAGISPEVPEKFEKKRFVFNSRLLNLKGQNRLGPFFTLFGTFPIFGDTLSDTPGALRARKA